MRCMSKVISILGSVQQHDICDVQLKTHVYTPKVNLHHGDYSTNVLSQWHQDTTFP